MMLELLFSLKISQIFLNDYASFLGTLYEKSKNMQKKSALTTLAGFPSPEQLTVTGELRRQAPDNSRAGAAGAAAEKSRSAGWNARGSFQHSVEAILQQYLPKLSSACPLNLMLQMIAENITEREFFPPVLF